VVGTTSVAPQSLAPSISKNNFTFSLEGIEPIITPQKSVTDTITPLIGGFNFIPSVLPNKVEPTISTTTNIFTNILKGLGFIKPSAIENDEQNLKMSGEFDSSFDPENSLYDDCNWYFENYCFRARLVDQLTTYNYESKLQVHFFISILKQIEWRSE
jgi:hypothetical protein